MGISQINITPAVTAGAYSQGDVIGGLITLSPIPFIDFSGFYLKQIVVRDIANTPNVSDLRLHFYDTLPATIADNAAYARADAELAKWIGAVDVTTFVANGSVNSAAIVSGLNVLLPAKGGSLWMYIETTDATPPTYTTTSDLSLALYVSDG